jgi:rRNA maturation protein Nop10
MPLDAVIPTDPMAQPDVAPAPPATPDQKYEAAVASRDPNALVSLAKETIGTPLSQISLYAADSINRKSKEFDELTSKIAKAGGATTPEGRMAVADTWKTVKDNPQWGDALLRYVLGDKQGAAKMITGGDITTKITFDKYGKQIKEQINGLGEKVDVIDLETGQPIGMSDYAKRGGGLPAWENTLGNLLEKENLKTNVQKLNENVEKNNAWSAKTAALTPKYTELSDLFSGLKNKDIPAEALAKVFQFANQSMGSTAAQSNNKSTLNQWNQGIGFKQGEQVSKQVASQFGLPAGIWTFNGKGGITNEKGDTKSFSELEQAQNTNNVSQENTKNFNQTQADLIKYLKTSKLNDADQTKLMRALELSRDIGREQIELVAKHGTPTFLTLPSAFNIEDQYSRGRVQALQGASNAEVMEAFSKFYNKAIQNYGPGQAPKPNEIENAFSNTDEYKNIQAKYLGVTKQILEEPRKFESSVKSEKPVTNKPRTAVVPGASGSTAPAVLDLNTIIPIKRKPQ